MKMKELKKGDFFTKKPLEAPKPAQVWVKGSYDRQSKAFSCYCFDDINKFCLVKSDKEVYTDFTF